MLLKMYNAFSGSGVAAYRAIIRPAAAVSRGASARLWLLAAITLFQFSLLSQIVTPHRETIITFDRNWQMNRAGTNDTIPACVPGCVHTDLLAAGKIPDPFYRLNESGLQWIDKADWEYHCQFWLNDSDFTRGNIELVFEGLDTYADVFLNGEKVCSADNMFRIWEINARSYLKKGINRLRVYFHSPINTDMPKLEKLGYALPADNDLSVIGGTGNNKLSVFARKAPYHYGWDWGPRFVTSGIWRPVYLKLWSGVNIQSVHIITGQITKQAAQLNVKTEINSTRPSKGRLSISVDGRLIKSDTVNISEGNSVISIDFEILSPKLWWPRNMGGQYLYSIKCELETPEGYSVKETNFGLRDVKVVQQPDSAGRTFYFEVNGVPVFMKGANYIPADIFPSRVSMSDYEHIIAAACDANMNMLRVWGGGIYEDDRFYNLCDRSGIMVWQDCMFACSMYPGDDGFLENVRYEITDNVKRLRNHPCVALWAGNNEIEDAWTNWGWQQRFTKEQRKTVYKAYTDLFLKIIPETIQHHDGTRFYWPSSPGSDYGKPSGPGSGDFHDWDVWHGKKPFENYQAKKGRFFSEYGFQSFPDIHTVRKYSDTNDWNIESDVMKAHQRSGIGNLRIRDYMRMYFREPKDFNKFLYVSQVQQAMGIKYAVEAHRRARPYTMGSLYWQLNDCWPVASWSGMDYYKRRKALHYSVKRAFAQVICAPLLKGDSVTAVLINDNTSPIKGILRVTAVDFGGRVIYADSINVTAVPAGNTAAYYAPKKKLLHGRDPRAVFVNFEFLADGAVVAQNILYLEYPKKLKLEKTKISLTAESADGGYYLCISSVTLAKDVCLDIGGECELEDNYFDLLPGRAKRVFAATKMSQAELLKKVSVYSLADSY